MNLTNSSATVLNIPSSAASAPSISIAREGRGDLSTEYSASDIRRILQQLFPHRRLVLSQFTFFNQIGVAKPTGELYRRGRRCYRLEDILSIATVLALKEEGIPLKNISAVPTLIQESSARIFSCGANCRLSGFGEVVQLLMPNDTLSNSALDAFLNSTSDTRLFWSYDVGALALQISELALAGNPLRKAA